MRHTGGRDEGYHLCLTLEGGITSAGVYINNTVMQTADRGWEWLCCSNCNVKTSYQTQKTHFHPQYQLKQSLGWIKKCRRQWRRTSRQGREGNEAHGYSPRDHADITVPSSFPATVYLSLVFPGSLTVEHFLNSHLPDVAIHVKAANIQIPFIILHFFNICE